MKKKDWEVKKLGEVYDVRDGTHDSPKFQETGFALITSKNLKKDVLNYDKIQYISEDDYKKINQRSKVDTGDILFAMIGTIGNPVVIEVDPDFAIKNVALFKIPEDQSNYFLKYYLDSKFVIDKMAREAKGTTQKFVGLGYLREFKIMLPCLSEQHRIVTILDEAFDAIETAKENAEKNLQNAKEIFESYLQSVFENPGDGWENKKLGEISKINYGYTEKASFEEIGPKFLRITDIQDNNVDWNTVPFCKLEKTELSKYQLSEGDIVFARTGATTGKSFLVKNPPVAVFASYLIRLKIIELKKLLPNFLFLYFQTKTYWDNIKIGLSGSAQGGFNASKLADMPIPIPSIHEQKCIVSKLDILSTETKKLESIYNQKLNDLEELKKSILQKAFNGEL